MRITFVLDSFGGGGKERRCLQLIQGLNQKGYNDLQIIIVNNDIDYPELFATTANIYIMDRKKKGMSHLQTINKLHYLFDEFKPDVVQVWGLMSAFYVNIVWFTCNFKYIGAYVADCNKPKGIKMLTNKACCLLTDKIVGNSLAGLKAYGIPQNKQVCIYNGYNKKRLIKLTEEAKLQKRNELKIKTKYVISMIARVNYYKDYKTFLEVAYRICKQRNDVTFLALGKGEQLMDYQKLAATEYESCVRFLGFRSDIDEILEITNLTCLFSNTNKHEEGVSNSILESMAHGVPVIASNAGGSPEIIKNGENGFLVNGNNPDIAVCKINYLLDNEASYINFSDSAKKTVDVSFNLASKTEEYIKVYLS